jgi:hypothetical protein
MAFRTRISRPPAGLGAAEDEGGELFHRQAATHGAIAQDRIGALLVDTVNAHQLLDSGMDERTQSDALFQMIHALGNGLALLMDRDRHDQGRIDGRGRDRLGDDGAGPLFQRPGDASRALRNRAARRRGRQAHRAKGRRSSQP